MQKCKTVVLKTGPDGHLTPEETQLVAKAAKSCKIVAFPTDTVYGLGSTGLIKAASRRIYQIKERPTLKPLPVFVHSVEAAKRFVEWTPAADVLARKFWPGAVTLVLRPTEQGRLLTFAEYQTVALRVPNQPALLELLRVSDVPWVQTSANRSGSPSLTDGADVARDFEGLVDYVIDGGKTPGIESTLVDATGLPVRVLREGAVKQQAVLDALQQSV